MALESRCGFHSLEKEQVKQEDTAAKQVALARPSHVDSGEPAWGPWEPVPAFHVPARA